ncbi:MAG TPA: sigma-70 family RNA polymerase sigma factor [Solirubrobacteraceae bacterium]|nr:sigma-70 family RNA polymerase sigma factor [Solirubrobacteraceae bacterium]
MPTSPPSSLHPSLDTESGAWLESLRADGPRREEAIARLHALLHRAARFEVARRRSSLPGWDGDDLDDLALQSADDALVAVLAKLDGFRGDSRFTTWAYKFALLEAAVKLRRRPWQGRELPLEPERWPQTADGAGSPHARTERAELLDAVREAIDEELTAHQREVLVAVALNEVPIDVLAERLGSTRGALYKTIHDARRKLRRRLEADGHAVAAPARSASR